MLFHQFKTFEIVIFFHNSICKTRLLLIYVYFCLPLLLFDIFIVYKLVLFYFDNSLRIQMEYLFFLFCFCSETIFVFIYFVPQYINKFVVYFYNFFFVGECVYILCNFYLVFAQRIHDFKLTLKMCVQNFFAKSFLYSSFVFFLFCLL